MPRVRSYVGLGANVGDAERTLTSAVRSLGALPGVRLRGVSRLYATAPWGVADQPEFRNAVVALHVPAGPDPATGALDHLVALKDLERAAGRAAGARWGPRALDLDILVFGRARIAVDRPPAGYSLDDAADTDAAADAHDDARPDDDASLAPRVLEIPHRDARERLFVLAPLADLAPGLVPPGWGETVETARRRAAAAEGDGAVRPIGTWDPAIGAWRAGQAGGVE